MKWLSIFCLMTYLAAPPSTFGQRYRHYMQQGTEAYERGEYGQAAQSFSKAYVLKQDLAALYNRSLAQFYLGDFEAAKKGFNQVAELAEDSSLSFDARYNEANALFHLEDYEAASKIYQGLLRERPGHQPSAHNWMQCRKKMQEQQRQKSTQENARSNSEISENRDREQANRDDQNQSDVQEQSPKKVWENPPALDKNRLDQLLNLTENEEQRTRGRLYDKKERPDQPKLAW